MPEMTLQQAFSLAMQHHQAGQLAEAEAIYRQILAVEPNQPEALHHLGVLAHQTGHRDAAVELIGKALGIRPAWPEALSNLGEILRTRGEHAAAAASFRQAIELAPEFASALTNLANTLNELGCAGEALEYSRRAIAADPNIALAWFSLANALQSLGRPDEAIPACQKAIQLDSSNTSFHNLLGVSLHEKGELQEAVNEFRTAIALDPNYCHAYSNLGVVLEALGQYEEALAACRQAIALQPKYYQAYYNLGNVFLAQQQFTEAIAAYRQAIEFHPGYTEAHCNLGSAYQDLGDLDMAINHYQRAIDSNPDYAEAHSNLGNVLSLKGQHEAALAAHRRAIALCPGSAEVQHNLANALYQQGMMDEAIRAYEQAIQIKPNFYGAYCNLGNTLKHKGLLDAAIQTYRKAIPHDPKNSLAYSNYLLTLYYSPDGDSAAIKAELARWEERYAAPLRSSIAPHLNDRSPQRRLRIGYVSPDLRDHSVGYFLLPLLEHHDREQYEIFAYAQVVSPDKITERLRAQTDVWRSTVGLSDAKVAEIIRADQIDILVDLAMHTADNRLLVFARKPAPVQVAYLAYVGSTGLSTMDYRLSDSSLDPPGMDESIYCERTIRLPGTYWCYRPTMNMEPRSATPQKDFITFGCLNNFCKINGPLLDQWAKILAAVPDSRLLLHAYEGDHRQALLDRFAQQGIAAERIEFIGRMPRSKYYRTYHSIDITLDTTPYGGGTTTCDSLWMGVPGVTLAGERAVGRGGVSILTNVGLPELIARTPEEYIQIAVELANDKARLQELRATLRERMQASPLMQEQPYARSIEAAYRQMWRTWCEQLAAKPSN